MRQTDDVRTRRATPVMRRRTGLPIAVALAMTLPACASGDDPVAEDPPTSPGVSSVETTPPTVADQPNAEAGTGWLAGAGVVETTVTELGTIRFDGVDTTADLSELELLLSTDDGPVSLPIYLDGGELTAVAPLHPAVPGEGGEVDLQFVAGPAHSGVLTTTLMPPPEADGAFDDVIDRFRAAIDGSASELGSSYAELAATDIDDVPMVLRPLKLVQGYVDDGTEHDLESLPAALGLDDDQLARLDALVAHLELTQYLGPAPGAGPQAFRAQPTILGTAGDRGPRTTPAQAGGGCFDGDVEVANVEQLVTQMAKGVDAIVREGGAEATVLAAIQSLGATIGALPLGAYGDIMGVIFQLFSLIEMYKSSVAGQYPTMLTSLVADMSITEFNEDFTADGHVRSVTLTAASTGWDASQLVAAAAAAVTGALSSKLTGRLKNQVNDKTSKDAIEAGGKLRDSLTGKYIDAVTANNYNICPQEWTVTFSDTKYVVLETSTAHFAVNDPALTYEPTRIGRGQLRVRADSAVFSGRTAEHVIPVETKRIRVISSPADVSVQRPGEVVSITTELEHADTKTLTWFSGPGRWADGIGDDTNDPGTRPYETPTDPDEYPYVMEIRSTSTTGLREGAIDFRNDNVTFKLAEIIVEPNPGNVEVRKQLTFVATDKNGTAVDVLWTATGGTITGGPSHSATYTAGSETGMYEVTATLASNPTVSVTVPVNVGEFCLVGTWRTNGDAFAASISSGGGIAVTHVGGSWDLTVNEDRTFTSVLSEFALAVEASGVEATMIMNGSQTGSVLATEIEIQAVETTSYELDVRMVTPAGTMSLPRADAPAGTEFGGGPYRCEGDQLIVNSDGYDILYDRIG